MPRNSKSNKNSVWLSVKEDYKGADFFSKQKRKKSPEKVFHVRQIVGWQPLSISRWQKQRFHQKKDSTDGQPITPRLLGGHLKQIRKTVWKWTVLWFQLLFYNKHHWLNNPTDLGFRRDYKAWRPKSSFTFQQYWKNSRKTFPHFSFFFHTYREEIFSDG